MSVLPHRMKLRINKRGNNENLSNDSSPKKLKKAFSKMHVCCVMNDLIYKESNIMSDTLNCNTCLVSLCTKKLGR
jgi:hypothetical protein